MIELQDATEALSKALSSSAIDGSEIESVRYATIPSSGLSALLSNPKGIARSIGVPVREGSEWHVSTVVMSPVSEEPRLRRADIWIIHYANCHGVIIIILR
jgi:hypothetical protein